MRPYNGKSGWKTIKTSPTIAKTLKETANFDINELKNFLFSKYRLVCITGAGISTRSGIPDYRGPNGSYSKGHSPMLHKDFVSNEWARKRYWSRSIIGFKDMLKAVPNDAHKAVARLQQIGVVSAIITQNVDGLHQKCGSENVIDLHGRLDGVSCLSCGQNHSRTEFQEGLEKANPSFTDSRMIVDPGMEARPDGDVDLGELDVSNFVIPECMRCGGILKPDVIFFGDSVPQSNKERAMSQVESSDGVLVVGSSLEVFSAFRLIRRAIELQIPLAVINMGETRLHRFIEEFGDTVTPLGPLPPILLINADCADVLHKVVPTS